MRPIDPPIRRAPSVGNSQQAPRPSNGSGHASGYGAGAPASVWPSSAPKTQAPVDAAAFEDFDVDVLRPDWQSGAAPAGDLLMSAPPTTFYDAHLQRLRGPVPAQPSMTDAGEAVAPTGAGLSSLARRTMAAEQPLDDPAVVDQMFTDDAPSTWATDAHLSSTYLTPGVDAADRASVAGAAGWNPAARSKATDTAGWLAQAAANAASVPAGGRGDGKRADTKRPPAFLRRAPRVAGRDPAPSRLTYRLQRLWLTPLFRRILGVGVPVFVIAFTVGVVVSDPARHASIVAMYDDFYTAFQDRPEFRVDKVAVQDASPEVAHAIEAHLAPLLPASSLRLDLEAQRAWIESLDAIASAELRLLAGGALEVRVTERVPVIIWRSRAGLELLDHSGARVAMLTGRAGRPDLPVIAGEGAFAHVPEALTLIATASPLADRLRGLVRVGDRRWDVVLDRDQRILLPETGARAALERALALHQAQDLLARDVSVVDLRMPARPTVRLAEGALTTLYSIRNQ